MEYIMQIKTYANEWEHHKLQTFKIQRRQMPKEDALDFIC